LKLIAKGVLVVLCLHATMQVACWKTVLVTRSPDHKNELKIKEWCIAPDCGIKVDVTSRFPALTLDQLSDASLLFAHVAWSPDSGTAVVLVVNGYGRHIEAAYDFSKGQPIAFDSARRLLSHSIVEAYLPSRERLRQYGDDAIEWAISDEVAHQWYLSKKHNNHR
jgi:hypothetical protein